MAATRTVTFDGTAMTGVGTGTVGRCSASVDWNAYPDRRLADNSIERAILV
ncbi:hypothetical protein ACFPIJ_64285 [Dactylosporangium cerinum]|uniref:Uncharacterized protein n=1 Tax=Dactylosporangium cerinum TaxID=1434730 RepID=A0ABV9WN83_9ACTN